jgi:hypothetical protein
LPKAKKWFINNQEKKSRRTPCKNMYVKPAVMCMIPPREILRAALRRGQPSRIFPRTGCAPYVAPGKISFALWINVLSREDFVFTIGYDGPVAVVDAQAKKKYGKFSTRELAEKGLFRAAYSSALYSKDSEEIKFVAEAYHRSGGHSSVDLSVLDRLFGVSLVDVNRTVSL